MYKFREDVNIKIHKTKASEDIGLSRPYLTNILNRKINCSKFVAFCITKYLDNNAEIPDYFERVK